MAEEVRVATPDKLADILRAVESVFGDELTDQEVDRYRQTIDVDRVIYVADGDEIVGGAGAYTFRSAVPGAVLPTGGVTLVGVKPSHRRRGILRSMIQHQFHDIHARGEPIATLWASEGPIYGRFGYGLASIQGWVDIGRERGRFVNDPGPRGRTRLVPLDSGMKTIAPVYDRVQQRTPGMFERTQAWWERRVLADPKEGREGASQKFLAAWEEDGEARAYVIYRIEGTWSRTGPSGSVQVQELIAEDEVALREMWRFVFGIDLTQRVKGRFSMLPIDSPLFLMLEDPRQLQASLSDALWLRVIDARAALEGRSFVGDGEVVLGLTDAMCPWNDGTWRLVARGGRAEVAPTDRVPELTLDASALGSLYLGTFTFLQLLRGGRAEEHAPGAAERADTLFHTTTAPYCPEIF